MNERTNLKKLLYIVAIDSPEVERLQIQYAPMEIFEGREARINNIPIVGRNEDLKQFSGGSSTLSFALTFFAVEQGFEDAKRNVQWLKSMTYKDGDRPPSRLKIVFGDLFKDELWVLNKVDVTYSVFQPASGWLPRYATADLAFSKIDDVDKTASQIRNWTF